MISKQHGGVARSVAASQLLNPQIDPELRSVCAEFLSLFSGFMVFSHFP